MKSTIKSISKYKKPIIVIACAAIVGASIYADWLYNGKNGLETGYIYNSSVSGDKAKILGQATYVGSYSDEENSSGQDTENYFSAAAIDRQRTRDEALETLQSVVDSAESMPEQKESAVASMVNIANEMDAESNVETLVKAKGFEDCIAVISGDNINVIVKSAGLLSYEVAQIKDIVITETGFSPENIKIIEKN